MRTFQGPVCLLTLNQLASLRRGGDPEHCGTVATSYREGAYAAPKGLRLCPLNGYRVRLAVPLRLELRPSSLTVRCPTNWTREQQKLKRRLSVKDPSLSYLLRDSDSRYQERFFRERDKIPVVLKRSKLGRDNQNRTGTSPVTRARRYQLTLSLQKIGRGRRI